MRRKGLKKNTNKIICISVKFKIPFKTNYGYKRFFYATEAI